MPSKQKKISKVINKASTKRSKLSDFRKNTPKAPPIKAVPQKESPSPINTSPPHEMILELLNSDTKYTRKRLRSKLMEAGIRDSAFGAAMDLLEATRKIVYIPPEVISIQEKDYAVVRLKQRDMGNKKTR